MTASTISRTILLVEDDADDRMLARRALRPFEMIAEIREVHHGQALLDYLARCTPFADAPRPDLILLDLNLPFMDGREALAHIKQHPTWRGIPVVVLTTSSSETDISRCYDSGAAAFFTKPLTFGGLQELLSVIGTYWLHHAHLPSAYER